MCKWHKSKWMWTGMEASGDMQHRISPKSSTIHLNVVLAVNEQAHVNIFCTLSVVLPMVQSRSLDIPAILESWIQLVCRTSDCSYGWSFPNPKRAGVSAHCSSRDTRKQQHLLTISTVPCHTPCSLMVSYFNRGPHMICKWGCMTVFIKLWPCFGWYMAETLDAV